MCPLSPQEEAVPSTKLSPFAELASVRRSSLPVSGIPLMVITLDIDTNEYNRCAINKPIHLWWDVDNKHTARNSCCSFGCMSHSMHIPRVWIMEVDGAPKDPSNSILKHQQWPSDSIPN